MYAGTCGGGDRGYWCMGWRDRVQVSMCAWDGGKGAGEHVVHGMEGRVQVSMWCMGWKEGCR